VQACPSGGTPEDARHTGKEHSAAAAAAADTTSGTKSMRNVLTIAFALLLAWHEPVLAQASRNILERLRTERVQPPGQFRPIDNPEKFAEDLVQTIANGAPNDAAATISDAIGQPAALSKIQNAFQAFNGKKFDFSKKVIDNEIGGALRQIVHYSYVEQLGFIYFRFNFKMTSKGWVLANFTFKSETDELLPKDF
jgi:hypothetical protein